MVGLFALRGIEGTLDITSTSILPVVGLICAGIPYYLRRERGRTMMDKALEAPHGAWIGTFAATAMLFMFAAIIEFGIQLVTEPPIVLTIVAIMLAYGIAWFPTVLIMMGLKAFSKLSATGRL
jgi:cellulose synthase/poly-beta-1,6-N-acetylglucosamine synthase-like glycosyltransferase